MLHLSQNIKLDVFKEFTVHITVPPGVITS